MNKKQIITISLTTLVILAIVYLLRRRKKPQSENTGAGGGSQTEVEAEGDPGPVNGGIQDNGNPNVGCQSNCCGNYCDEISENNPAMNYGCCGIHVKNFQSYLNSVVPQSVYPQIDEDGAYGSQTQAKHEAMLTMMPTTGQDITAGLYEQGSGS